MEETNREIDLGTMTLYDSNAVPIGKNDQQTIRNVTDATVQNVKFIFLKTIEAKKNQISLLESLPEEQQIHDFSKSKLYVNLPESGILFPRSFKLPEEKKLTKWEKFAKEKGIHKKKRSGMVYDPELKQQVARWGSKSKKNVWEPPVLEQKIPGRNPFDDLRANKKLGKAKQKLKEIRNIQHRTGGKRN